MVVRDQLLEERESCSHVTILILIIIINLFVLFIMFNKNVVKDFLRAKFRGP